MLPLLWLAAFPAALRLAADGCDRRFFLGLHGVREAWRGILARAAAAAVLMTVLVPAIAPGELFRLPRERPLFWLLIVCCYPLLSVFPQGILYRALYYRRYAALFPRPWLARLAGAMAFSFCHLFFLNGWALLLTLAGGWMFNRTYERTRSPAAANIEHAIHGCLLFTIGLGRFFYHGTQALLD